MDFFSFFAIQEIINSVNRYINNISASVADVVIEEEIKKENISSVKINSEIFPLWHAKTKQEMQQGLSNIDWMPEKQGMIFTYTKADNHYFWMKGMLISLDFIWVKDNIIVDIFSKNKDNWNAFTSDQESDTIIEFQKGTCEKYNIKVGDKIEIIYD